MSAVATSIRALLLTITLMMLARGTVAIPTGLLSSIGGGDPDAAAVRTHGHRHQHGDAGKFETLLTGPTVDEEGDVQMMAAVDDGGAGIFKRRSLSGSGTIVHEEHITNELSSTIFYHKHSDGKMVLTAYNTTPNISNSIFHYASDWMDPTINKSLRGTDSGNTEKMTGGSEPKDGMVFRVGYNGSSYYMCAKGKRVKLVISTKIKIRDDAEDCVWKTFPMYRGRKLIYTKYKNSCKPGKATNRKCLEKRGFLTIHRKKPKPHSTSPPKLKVLLRFKKPPLSISMPKKFWLKPHLNESTFYLHNRSNKGQRYPNPSHLGTTAIPHRHKSMVDPEGSKPKRRRKCKGNLLQVNCTPHRPKKGHRHRPSKSLLEQEHRSDFSLISEKQPKKSMLDGGHVV